MKTLIEAPFLVTGDQMDLIKNGYILIDDQRIAEIGSGEAPDADRRIQFEESMIMPGLINAHTHIGDSAFKDVGFGKNLIELFQPPNGLKHQLLKTTERQTILEAIENSLLDMLSSGTTTFADFREGAIDGVRILLEALRNKKIRAFIFGRSEYTFSKEQLEENRGEIEQESLDALEGLIAATDGVAPSSPNDATDQALRQVAKMAKVQAKLRATHAAENPDSERISKERTGLSEVERAIEHLEADILVHLTYASPKDLDLVEEHNIRVVCCPRTNATLGLRLPPIQEMIDRGIVVGLGTDNVMLNSPNMLEEMKFTTKAYRIEKIASRYLKPREVLMTATISGARVLGIDHETGSIEEGKHADLVVLDLASRNLKHTKDPLTAVTHRAQSDNVRLVMLKGEIAHQSHMAS